MRTALVIINPIAGARMCFGCDSLIRRGLRRNGIDAEVYETRQRGDAEAAARRYGATYDMVIAAGGDGTINEVAAGLRDTGVALGVVPLGTANVLARELGIPTRVEPACAAIASGRPRSIDIGIARWGDKQHIFLCMAGAGFDAAVAHAYKSVRGKSSRIHKYVPPILKEIQEFDFPPIRATIDGKPTPKEATSVIVGNVRTYGGPFSVTPHAKPDDGRLHLFALFSHNRRDLIRCIWGAMTGGLVEYPDVLHLAGEEIDLESEKTVHLQLDGDAVGSLPARLSVVHRAISVIVPVGPA